MAVKDEPNWRMKHLTSTIAHLPATPGIYVIGHEESIAGLELRRIYVYVGKTKNMRRRLSEHSHLTELHPELSSYLRENRGKAKIWYTTDIAEEDLDGFERTLVRALKTIYNRIKYEKGTRK